MLELIKELVCFFKYQLVRLLKRSNLNKQAVVALNATDFGITDNDIEDIKNGIDQALESPNDLIIWSDEKRSDMRIHGFENVYQFKRTFLNIVIDIAKKSHCSELSHFSVLGARMKHVEGNIGSGGGWHRDSAHRSQVKVIVYLSDVTDINGPFQYVPSSHWTAHLLKYGGLFSSKLRYTPAEVSEMQTPITVTAKAGAGIVVDTKCVHRGKPMSSGERYALTFYFFDNGSVSPTIRPLINGDLSPCQ